MTLPPFRAVIVDDLAAQRDHLRSLLAEHDTCTVAGEFGTVEDAVEGIRNLKPDLLFLDVMLSPGTGFDVLQALGEASPPVIFTTSFEQYALRAIKLSAVDYLLKPYGRAELGDALARFGKKRSTGIPDNRISALMHNRTAPAAEQQFCIPVSGGSLFLPVGEIIRFESRNVHVVVFTADQKEYLAGLSLRELEALFEPVGFIRVHQSHLVNPAFVREFRKGDQYSLVLRNGTLVEVSRRRKDEVMARLRNRSL
jgi:two-component system, LytTR family, response regulator